MTTPYSRIRTSDTSTRIDIDSVTVGVNRAVRCISISGPGCHAQVGIPHAEHARMLGRALEALACDLEAELDEGAA